jgi:hypothetical protein
MPNVALSSNLIVLWMGGSAAFAAGLPVEVAKRIEKSYPGAKILAETRCGIGAKAIDSFGLLIQRQPVKKGDNPLDALIVYKKSDWRLLSLPHRIQYATGGDADFLSDFWSAKGFEGGFEVRCTTPKTDKDINTKAHGVFESFAAALPANTRHLCFAASASYNSWNCFTYNDAKSAPETSFVQMNGD